MSVNYKAQIVQGFELMKNWNEIIDEDFFEEHINNFFTTSVYYDDFVLFGIIIEEVDERYFVECNYDIFLDEVGLLREFANKYPKAIANTNTIPFGSKYLICKED